MLICLRTLICLGLIASPLLAQAGTEVAGVNVDKSCNMDNQSMGLNGAGIRSKYFIKIYVGVLCIEQPGQDSAAILTAPGATRSKSPWQ